MTEDDSDAAGSEAGHRYTYEPPDPPDFETWREHVGWLVEESCAGHTATELADALDGVSYNQVRRRLRQARDGDDPYYSVREAAGHLARRPADDRTDGVQAALDAIRAAAEAMEGRSGAED